MTPRRAPPPDSRFEARSAKRIPFDFVLDELELARPRTNPMFGCHAVYVGEKIVLILRDRPSVPSDNGVWVATTREHHGSLHADLPSLRNITVLGETSSAWQIIPKTSRTFEEEALRACALILARDPRIGKVPKPRRARASKASVAGEVARPPAEKAARAPAGRKKTAPASAKRKKTARASAKRKKTARAPAKRKKTAGTI